MHLVLSAEMPFINTPVVLIEVSSNSFPQTSSSSEVVYPQGFLSSVLFFTSLNFCFYVASQNVFAPLAYERHSGLLPVFDTDLFLQYTEL